MTTVAVMQTKHGAYLSRRYLRIGICVQKKEKDIAIKTLKMTDCGIIHAALFLRETSHKAIKVLECPKVATQ